jgi:hypothetical protein
MKPLSIFSAILLLLAIPPIWPYEYYMILRIVICASAVFHAYKFYEKKNDNWMWVFGVIAVVFNPFVPLSLNKGAWSIIDIVAAVLFIVCLFSVSSRK